jgi:hypothetical protein
VNEMQKAERMNTASMEERKILSEIDGPSFKDINTNLRIWNPRKEGLWMPWNAMNRPV